ncbi:unnamed protein product [Rotaria sp. Silwood2]|nr:unnamed protein product [Rotaria sp. Silwood2]CAF2779965.1 unnamed protein product [Rotaria sp. Silwood2]CAF3095308.1 unnamed protein product [Rotaria sp. Silwood2]
MTNNNTINQETIESLCDRLQSATRIEDRRDTVYALEVLSKKCKLEVGTKSIILLANILQGDRTDLDSIQLVLEALTNLIAYDVGSDEEQSDLPQGITVQFTELYIQNKKRVHVVLELIAKTNFNVRRAAIRFLTALLTNCTEELQDIILESGPAGFSKLLDLLEDKREVIRNDALLLFQVLIRSNWCIQGIFVLEYGFERLLRILVSKYGSDGNVTIEDCLSIILTLFESNQSNQSYFRRRSYIPRLFSFFERGLIGEKLWSIQKVTNIHLLLKIIQTLVSPTNSNENIIACQRTVKQCGILRRLCIMLMLTTVPDDILSETINTIADIVRGNIENQQFLGSIMDITAEVQQLVKLEIFWVYYID